MSAGQYKVKSRSGKKETSISYDNEETVKLFIKKCSQKFRLNANRIRLSYKKSESEEIVLKESEKIGSYNIPDGATLVFKDLGYQVGYGTVFFLEYVGPFLMLPLIFLFSKLVHMYYYPEGLDGASQIMIDYAKTFNNVQILGLLLWVIHYGKRLFETVFVHSFSHATMPLSNLFKNCTYYWGFAFLIGYMLSHPLYIKPPLFLVILGTLIFFICEYLNFSTHYYLSTLRNDKTKKEGIDHPIPTKWMFHYAICPNYSFEILSWLGFNLATFTGIGFIFNVLGAVQMFVWAKAKKKRYLKDFGEKKSDPANPEFPKKVKLLFPYII